MCVCVCVCVCVSIHLSMDIYVLAVVNNAAINIRVCVPF